jgi:hypothetical protein
MGLNLNLIESSDASFSRILKKESKRTIHERTRIKHETNLVYFRRISCDLVDRGLCLPPKKTLHIFHLENVCYNTPARKWGRQASTGTLNVVAMHAGLPYAAR